MRSHGGFQKFGKSRPCTIDVDGRLLKEFPFNLKFILRKYPLIFSGGGYFRLLPDSLLHNLFSSSDYIMTYFHPRDFDAEQPVIDNLSLFRRFKSYYGLKGCMGKLANLLAKYEFMDIRIAANSLDWTKTDVRKF